MSAGRFKKVAGSGLGLALLAFVLNLIQKGKARKVRRAVAEATAALESSDPGSAVTCCRRGLRVAAGNAELNELLRRATAEQEEQRRRAAEENARLRQEAALADMRREAAQAERRRRAELRDRAQRAGIPDPGDANEVQCAAAEVHQLLLSREDVDKLGDESHQGRALERISSATGLKDDDFESVGIDVEACRAAYETVLLRRMVTEWGVSPPGVEAICAAGRRPEPSAPPKAAINDQRMEQGQMASAGQLPVVMAEAVSAVPTAAGFEPAAETSVQPPPGPLTRQSLVRHALAGRRELERVLGAAPGEYKLDLWDWKSVETAAAKAAERRRGLELPADATEAQCVEAEKVRQLKAWLPAYPYGWLFGRVC